MPILIVNMDGVLGYWDDQQRFYFVFRQKIIEGLIQLSYDFRLVAVSSQRTKLINKVVQALMNIPAGSEATGGEANLKHLLFDAVYQLRSVNKSRKWTCHMKNIDEIHFDLS